MFKRFIVGLCKWVAGLVSLAILFPLAVNLVVILSTAPKIDDGADTPPAQAILVLGASVRGKQPSPMLRERLDAAIDLYQRGVAPKIIMSGDRTPPYYDEPGIMKVYAVEQGVPAGDIFTDGKGFSTFESLLRAREVYGITSVVVVSQRYHLYRAVFTAGALGMQARGVAAGGTVYPGDAERQWREVLARIKDVVLVILPKPAVGDAGVDITADAPAS